MQAEEKLLTVAEFAVLANISKQRVYQLLNNRLNAYVVTKNGTKMIRESGIEAVKQARVKQGFNKSLKDSSQDLIAEIETLKVQNAELTEQLEKAKHSRVEQGLNKSLKDSSQDLIAEIETLKAQNAELTEQLEKAKHSRVEQGLTIERITAECERTRQCEKQSREKLENVLREAAVAESEHKRADAAEHQCAVKDEQIAALTAALQSAQQQAAELTTALAASQALQAGQIRLAMQNSDDGEKPVDEHEPPTKRGWLQKIFKRKKS